MMLLHSLSACLLAAKFLEFTSTAAYTNYMRITIKAHPTVLYMLLCTFKLLFLICVYIYNICILTALFYFCYSVRNTSTPNRYALMRI